MPRHKWRRSGTGGGGPAHLTGLLRNTSFVASHAPAGKCPTPLLWHAFPRGASLAASHAGDEGDALAASLAASHAGDEGDACAAAAAVCTCTCACVQ